MQVRRGVHALCRVFPLPDVHTNVYCYVPDRDLVNFSNGNRRRMVDSRRLKLQGHRLALLFNGRLFRFLLAAAGLITAVIFPTGQHEELRAGNAPAPEHRYDEEHGQKRVGCGTKHGSSLRIHRFAPDADEQR